MGRSRGKLPGGHATLGSWRGMPETREFIDRSGVGRQALQEPAVQEAFTAP